MAHRHHRHVATFMEVLDTTVVNVSLPHIAGSLCAGIDESTWVFTSYLVSNAIVLPLQRVALDVFGRKRFYMICVAIFTISSMMCGLARLPHAVFFRGSRARGAAAFSRFPRQFSSIVSRAKNKAWPWPSMAWASS